MVTSTPMMNRATQWLLTTMIMVIIGINWWPTVDAWAQAYLQETLTGNTALFALVRTLNGLISVVQSAEIGVGVAGIGIGELFDPVNDLIERFSGWMLVTLTALGVQQVLLIMLSSTVCKILLTFLGLLTLVGLWRPVWGQSLWWRWAAVGLVARFFLVLQIGLVWLFDVLYFNATGAEALSTLEAGARLLDSLRNAISDFSVRDLFSNNNQPDLNSDDIGNQLSQSVVTLMVGLLIKSLLIPIGSLWLGAQLIRQLLTHERR